LGAGLVWIVAGVVGLLGLVLSVTLILLPLGIPLLMLARKLGALATAMALPKSVRHPVETLSKKGSAMGDDAGKKTRSMASSGRKALQGATKSKRRFGFRRRSKLERFVDWVIG
jgi:hypothetical protein